MPFTIHTGFWALEAEKLLSLLPYSIFYFIKGKISYGAGKLLLLPRSGGHPCEWACLYGTFWASGFSWQPRQEPAVTGSACQAVMVTFSGWMVVIPVPCALWTFLRQAGIGSAQRQCIYYAAWFAWESGLGRAQPLTRRAGKAKQTRKKKYPKTKQMFCQVSQEQTGAHCVTKELFASSIKHSFCGLFCVYCSEYIDWQECSWEQWILCKY